MHDLFVNSFAETKLFLKKYNQNMTSSDTFFTFIFYLNNEIADNQYPGNDAVMLCSLFVLNWSLRMRKDWGEIAKQDGVENARKKWRYYI